MSIVPADEAAVVEAARRLLAGEVVGMPTETVYGLAADAGSAAGVAAVYRIKGRPADHPLIVHVLDLEQARWWGEFDDLADRLARAFWPGPLTLIVRRRVDAPAFACGGEPTVGLRCPAHPVARALIAEFTRIGGHGIAAPSANRFGRVSPTRAEHVANDLGDDVGLVLDGGPCDVGLESTIVDLSRGRPVLLRPGGIDETRLAEVLGAAPAGRDAQAPRASGTLAAHYAPRTPLELVDEDLIPQRLRALDDERAVRPDPSAGGSAPHKPARSASESAAPQLGRSTGAPQIGRSTGAPRIGVWSANQPAGWPYAHWESMPADAAAVARAMYDTLRRLDTLGLDRILVGRVPSTSDWDAVRDRLERAAASF